MAEHRYTVGNFAVVVDDAQVEEVRFENGPGGVIARLTWNEVSELQRALVTAEEGENRRRREEQEAAIGAHGDGSAEQVAPSYAPLTPEEPLLDGPR